MKNASNQVREQMYSQVMNQVMRQVGVQNYKVWCQVGKKVMNQVWDQTDQVENQINGKR